MSQDLHQIEYAARKALWKLHRFSSILLVVFSVIFVASFVSHLGIQPVVGTMGLLLSLLFFVGTRFEDIYWDRFKSLTHETPPPKPSKLDAPKPGERREKVRTAGRGKAASR